MTKLGRIEVSPISPLDWEAVMRFNNLLTLAFILTLLFISIGDRILPSPLNDASRNTRVSINNFLVGLFPDRKPKDPNRRTKEAIDQLNQGNGQ
jgi:hypothetical protein